MDSKFVFLILHYLNADVTIRCIESIINTIQQKNFEIVVVDNASNNGSVEELVERYGNKTEIHFLFNKVNLGYAQGNNVGFVYAKNILHADFICLANNDVIFSDKQWCNKVLDIYEKESYYVLGPDVVTPQGEHQNPFRPEVFGIGKVMKNLFHDIVVYILLKLGIQKKIRNKLNIKSVWENCNWSESQFDFSGVLHGSCLIFSPAFIGEFDGFYKGTFLYVEEDILFYILHKLHCKYVYCKDLQVLHYHATSLKRTIQDENQRKMMAVKNRIKSYAKFLKIILNHKKAATYLKA